MKRAWKYSDLQKKTKLPKQQQIQAVCEEAKARSPKLTESQQQAKCVDWFRSEYPQFTKLFWANPNGGYRSPKTAAILKREGVLSGVPDVTLAVPRKSYHGLYIEVKTEKGRPTENQLAVMAALSEQGYQCAIVHSIDEFKETVINYLKAA